MKLKKVRMGLALLLCVLATGCWDKIELENRGFVVSIGVDKSQARYTVTVAMPNVINIKENGVSDKAKSVKSADSGSVSGAFHLIDLASSQKLFLKQAKMLMFGEDLLKDKKLFKQAIDAVERSRDISRKMFLIATSKKAKTVLSEPMDGEPMLGMFMENFYKNSQGGGAFFFRQTLQQTILDLRSSGSTMIPVLEIKDSKNGDSKESDTGKILFTGCAVIKEFQLAGYLNGMQTRGFEWVNGDCRDAVIMIPADGRILPMRVTKHKTKTRFYEEGQRLICDISICVTGNLEEYSFTEKLYDPKSFEGAFAEAIKDEVTQTADLLQNTLAVDVYHFGDNMRKNNHKLYERFQNNWDESFQSMKIIPRVRVEIVSTGSIQ